MIRNSKHLTESMQEETSSSYTGWHRLGNLMMTLGQMDKAEEVYEILLKQTSDQNEIALIFHQFGYIKDPSRKIPGRY